MPRTIEIWTDGSCNIHTRVGGYGFIISNGSKNIEHEKVFIENDTTISRCELLGVLKGLEFAKANGYQDDYIYIFTDSQYVQRGLTEWMETWKGNNWRTTNRKDVANQDLWKQIDEVKQSLKLHVSWVRGHNGSPFNERIDKAITKHLKHSRDYPSKSSLP